MISFLKSDLFQRQSPVVISQSVESNHAKLIEFDETKFFTFSVADGKKQKFLDLSIFSFEFIVRKIKSDENGGTQVYYNEISKIHACTKEDVKFNPDLFQSLQLKNSLCLDDKRFQLEGDWDEPDIKYIVLNLYMCDNKTYNNQCKSQEQIELFFSNKLYFAIQFHDTLADLTDYKNPYKISYKTDYILMDTMLNKRETIKIKTSEIVTDEGWIFHDYNAKSNFLFDSKDFDFILRKNSYPLGQYNIFASKTMEKNSRRYETLPEALGSLVGIAHLIMAICFLVTNLVTHVSTLRFVLNQLYRFHISNEIINRFKNKLKENTIENTNITIENLFKPHVTTEKLSTKISLTNPKPKVLEVDSFVLEKYSQEKINNIDEEIPKKSRKIKKTLSSPTLKKKSQNFSEFNEKKEFLSMGYLEYICVRVYDFFKLKLDRKKRIIIKGEKLYKEEIDIINILLRLQEIEKIKKFLFDDDQLLLFECISKPIITLEEDDYKKIKSESRSSYQFKTNSNLSESYKKIAGNAENSKINQRIISFIDENILKLKQSN